MDFPSLGLSPALLRALSEQGYTTPTPVQNLAIPLILDGRDLLAGSQTGTGKTAAFALPLLHRMMEQGKRRQPRHVRTLVLTPTRELAAQVHESFKTYGRHLGLRTAQIFGGVNINPQTAALRGGLDVLVATPGRLIDHMQQGNVNLGQVDALVLDEADRMLDMGFLPALRKILNTLPKDRQSLMFSATFADEIRKLAQTFLRDPEQLQIASRNAAAPNVAHTVHPVDSSAKKDVLLHLLADDSRRQALVFARTKHGSDKLVRWLCKSGVNAAAIHGNKSQNARTRALADFKSGRVTVLVATDIAARGLDIDQLPIVINHDLPMVAEDYVHRIGRTGRNGASGLAVSLVCQDEIDQLRGIQRLLPDALQIEVCPGFEPSVPLNMNGRGKRPGNNAGRRQNPSGGRGRSNQGPRNGSGKPARAAHGHPKVQRPSRTTSGNRAAQSN